MPKTSGPRTARPKNDDALVTARRAKDAERKRRAYWADPVKARAKARAKRQRNLERCRAQSRARYWANPEKSRAQARERARTERGRASNRRAVATYRQRHPEIVAAQREAQKALRRGELRVPTVCQALGCNKSKDLHLHHHRYDRPQDVVAVSRSHHTAAHRGAVELKPGGHRKWARAPDTSVRCH
jgi:hypothetical protein